MECQSAIGKGLENSGCLIGNNKALEGASQSFFRKSPKT
jgi:hypothetical protein